MTNTTEIQQNWLNNASISPTNLMDWGLIMVEGPDAASFLQNQLTNSVLGLTRTLPGLVALDFSATRLVGYCSPKGRLLASAWLGLFPTAEDAEDRFALFISKDIAATTAKRLSMYVLRSKVKVTDLSNDWNIVGLYGSDDRISGKQFTSSCIQMRMPDVLVGKQSIARLLIACPKELQIHLNCSDEQLIPWNALEVLSAIPRIVLATQERFVPQMINFESVAGVDFKKGCYPGQEIVARSQYRGAIKRRLQLAHAVNDGLNVSLFSPGAELFHTEDPGQPAGMVVLSAQSPNNPQHINLQVECKLEALECGEIHVGSIEGPVLKIDSLPYPLLEI